MFFIVALPRSRTAWLANFFTSGDVFCYHEALNGCHSADDFKEKMSLSRTHVGNADCGLPFVPFQKWYPEANTVIIERPVSDVLTSLCKLFPGTDVSAVVYAAKERMDTLQGLRVPFDEIDERLEEIWDYCVGDGFDQHRSEMLKQMRIETKNLYGDIASYDAFVRV